MQAYRKELSNLWAKFAADITFSTINLTHAMGACVKAFSIRYEVHWYDLKHPDFLNKRENQC